MIIALVTSTAGLSLPHLDSVHTLSTAVGRAREGKAETLTHCRKIRSSGQQVILVPVGWHWYCVRLNRSQSSLGEDLEDPDELGESGPG